MGIKTESQLVIVCDTCGEMETSGGQGREYSLRGFRLDGWTAGKRVTCPKCNRAKRKAKANK